MASLYQHALDNLLKLRNFEFKEKQREVFDCIMNKKDCLAVLPTGYGKSLPHQLYVQVKKALGSVEKMIVCCPTVSLMEDQVQRMSKFGDTKAAFWGKDAEIDAQIESGEFDVIFGSPEALAEEWVRNLKNVSLIVVDECHTISTWGGLDGDEEKAFRKYFRYIGTLRSVFPDATLLALSATCTLKMKKQIIEVLNMTNQVIIEISPHRENIKIVVKRTPTEIEKTLFGLVDNVSEMKEGFPRTLIYCNSIQDVSKIYHYLTSEIQCEEDLIEMYHSETSAEKKESIVKNLSINSNLRIVVATSALGMGVDVRSCNTVILYGPPKDIVDLMQESGRCGRDGTQSVCIVLCNRYQLGRVNVDVKSIIKCTDCRRKTLLSNFTNEQYVIKYLHNCCDLCADKCKCGSCTSLPIETYMDLETSPEYLESGSSSDSDTISYEYESD